MSSMGGGGSSGPTPQQQLLETQQATTTAQLNLEENEQRKAILNNMQGMRSFRGSALTRAVAGNEAGGAAPGPSPSQLNAPLFNIRQGSLLDVLPGSGAGGAGGAGPSNSGAGAGRGGTPGGGTGGGGRQGGRFVL